MRHLLGCPSCRRQYDVTGREPGTALRCRCGTALEVGRSAPRELAVVRCSACGGTRDEGAASCRWCGSDFTAHDQDLDTICPSCFARISDRARFCHHCAAPIVPESGAGPEGPRACPACGPAQALRSRALGDSGLSALECARCAGLWLERAVFERLTERARREADPNPDAAGLRRTAHRTVPGRQAGPMYRRCPVCASTMNRSNFGRHSGILVDRCREHGLWFDASELDAALRWIRSGGEALAARRQEDEERTAASAARFRVEPKIPEAEARRNLTERDDDPIGSLLHALFGL